MSLQQIWKEVVKFVVFVTLVSDFIGSHEPAKDYKYAYFLVLVMWKPLTNN